MYYRLRRVAPLLRDYLQNVDIPSHRGADQTTLKEGSLYTLELCESTLHLWEEAVPE